jgi:hypothetical protein
VANDNFVRRRRHADDSGLTDQIKQVVDARPSYGYLRTTWLVSRAMVAAGGAPVNRKRVYRIMKSQGWLLARHTGKWNGCRITGRPSEWRTRATTPENGELRGSQ